MNGFRDYFAPGAKYQTLYPHTCEMLPDTCCVRSNSSEQSWNHVVPEMRDACCLEAENSTLGRYTEV